MSFYFPLSQLLQIVEKEINLDITKNYYFQTETSSVKFRFPHKDDDLNDFYLPYMLMNVMGQQVGKPHPLFSSEKTGLFPVIFEIDSDMNPNEQQLSSFNEKYSCFFPEDVTEAKQAKVMLIFLLDSKQYYSVLLFRRVTEDEVDLEVSFRLLFWSMSQTESQQPSHVETIQRYLKSIHAFKSQGFAEPYEYNLCGGGLRSPPKTLASIPLPQNLCLFLSPSSLVAWFIIQFMKMEGGLDNKGYLVPVLDDLTDLSHSKSEKIDAVIKHLVSVWSLAVLIHCLEEKKINIKSNSDDPIEEADEASLRNVLDLTLKNAQLLLDSSKKKSDAGKYSVA